MGFTCRLDAFQAQPCGTEDLPNKLEKQVVRKANRAASLLLKAEEAVASRKLAKADKLRERAMRQLDAILKKSAKAVEKRNEKQRISVPCRTAIDALVALTREAISPPVP